MRDDPDDVIAQLQIVFATLQETTRQSVGMKPFCLAYRDTDGSPLQTSQQMDVEEFMNQLFDRMETSLEETADSDLLQDHFGGKLLQQVISQACDHVSEREEPFFAVQCTVKGKRTVQDSLQELIAGETLDGENMYHCERCNKKVPAIKRVCLKALPPTLILHLKRIEFDLELLDRIKINDACQFPPKLDMTPYTVEHLSRDGPDPPGYSGHCYRLVGVLVHRGTAQSGHYYSFIQEREGNGRWMEFNDELVNEFDVSQLAAETYGGADMGRWFNVATQPLEERPAPKTNNAYLLFYERIPGKDKVGARTNELIQQSSVEPAAKLARFSTSAVDAMAPPLNALTPLSAGARMKTVFESVWEDNAQLEEDSYVFCHENFSFVVQVCELYGYNDQLSSPVRARALHLGLVFFCSVLCHAKERGVVGTWVDMLKNCMHGEAIMAAAVLDQFLSPERNWLQTLLFVCPHDDVRRGCAQLLLACMQLQRNIELPLYAGWQSPEARGLQRTPETISRNLQVIHQIAVVFLPRAQAYWSHLSEVYELLYEFANFGRPEAEHIIKCGILYRAIEFFLGSDSPFPPPPDVKPLNSGDHLANAPYKYLVHLTLAVAQYVDKQLLLDPIQYDQMLGQAERLTVPQATLYMLLGDSVTKELKMSFLVLQLEQELDLNASHQLIRMLCFECPTLSKQLIESLCVAMRCFETQRLEPFLAGLATVVSLPDQHMATRIGYTINQMQQMIQTSEKDLPVLEHCLSFLANMCRRLPIFARFFRSLPPPRWYPAVLFNANSASVRRQALELMLALVEEETRNCFEGYVLHGDINLLSERRPSTDRELVGFMADLLALVMIYLESLLCEAARLQYADQYRSCIVNRYSAGLSFMALCLLEPETVEQMVPGHKKLFQFMHHVFGSAHDSLTTQGQNENQHREWVV